VKGDRSVLRALRHRVYRLFLGSLLASLVGMWLMLVAQAWIVVRLTDQATYVAIVYLAQLGPGFFIMPFAGALADRYSRKRMLIVAQSAAFLPALAMGLLTISGVITTGHVIFLAFLTGCARSFEIPIRQAFVPSLVEREDIPNAVALNSILFNCCRLAGPAAAGVVIAQVGEGWCFLANAALFAPVLVSLFAIRAQGAPTVQTTGSLSRSIGAALRYVGAAPVLWSLLGGMAVASVIGMPYTTLLPSFATRVLGADEVVYGMLTSAVGLGAFGSALVLAMRRGVEGLERWVVGAGLFFAASLSAFSQTTALWASLLLLVCIGTGFMFMMAGTSTLLQLRVPDSLRGRVMSFHTTVFLGAFPFGGLVAGRLADRYGEAPVLLGAGLVVACGLTFFGRILLRAERDPGVQGERDPQSPPRVSGA
jgi:MFS family permease